MPKIISGGAAKSPRIQKFYPDYFQNQELSGSIGPPKNGSSGGQGGSVTPTPTEEPATEEPATEEPAKSGNFVTNFINNYNKGADRLINSARKYLTKGRQHSDMFSKKVH